MDIGLGSFLEKFEDHFGRGLTKAMLTVIGLAVASICGSVIWSFLLKPLAEALPDPRTGVAYEVAKLALILSLFLMITNQLIQLADNYARRNLRREMREKLAEARRLTESAKETFEHAERLRDEAGGMRDEAVQLQKETGDTLAAADLVLQQVLSGALERGWITPEQADELRGLRDRLPPTGAPEPSA